MNPAPEASQPEDFGPYKIYERLGLGGMAQVHRAKKQGIEGYERVVALKRMLSHLTEDAHFVESFVREAKVASMLVHPNIAQIYDFGRINGIYYIAMEQVDGFDLRKLLRFSNQTNEPIPLGVVLSILYELCDALEFAHNFRDETGQPMHIVHRDISPSNLILAHTGHLKVIDFGIAKASSRQLRTESGRVKGKLGYMSPEAAMGNVLGPISDVFSVGVVAHELLTARPLFSAKTDFETMLRIREGEIYPPSRRNPTCPPMLDRIVLQTLARDASQRTPTAGALRAQLDNVAMAAGVRVSARDVAEWCTRIPRVSGRMTGPFQAPIRNSSDQSGGFAPRVSNVTMPSRPKRSSQLPLPAPPAEEDEADVWADDQPNPTVTPNSLADFSAASGSQLGVAPVRHSGAFGAGSDSQARQSVPAAFAPTAAHVSYDAYQAQFGSNPSHDSQHPHPNPYPQPSTGSIPSLANLPHAPSMHTAPMAAVGLPSSSVPSLQPAPAPIAAAPPKSRAGVFALVILLLAGAAGVVVYALAFRGTGEPTVDLAAPSASLHFLIEPPDATIEIGGKAIATMSPYESQLAPGMYTITVKKPGFETFSSSITLKDGEHQNVNVALVPATGATGSAAVVATGGSGAPKSDDTTEVTDDTDDDDGSATTAVAGTTGKRPPKTTGKTTPKTTPKVTAKIDPIPQDPPKEDPPKVEPPKVEPPKLDPPKLDPPKADPPKVEPPKPTRIPTVQSTAVSKLSGDLPAIKVTGQGGGSADLLVKLCIDESGRVTSVTSKKATPEIMTQLQAALMRWRYKPYRTAANEASAACFGLSLRVVLKN